MRTASACWPRLVGHGGAYPGYLTSTRISPREKVGVIVFTNAMDTQPEIISDRIFEWIAPAISSALQGETSPEVEPNWAKYVGTYRSIWTDYHVLPLDGKLSLIVPNSPNPKNKLITLKPTAEHTFCLEGPGNAPVGEPVVFEIGEDGQAERIIIGVNPATKVTYPD